LISHASVSLEELHRLRYGIQLCGTMVNVRNYIRAAATWCAASLFVASCLLPLMAAPLKDESGNLPNFATVSPGIYRGGAPTVVGLQNLKAMGVRTIIDLRISPKLVKQEKTEAQHLGFNWINLPMGADPPTTKQVATFIATLKLAPAQAVFVHCQHGADRTGCMIGIWRETQQGWSYDRSWAEMRKYGFDPRWNKLSDAVKQRSR
jgi:protein tyrosine/serine phosphatase